MSPFSHGMNGDAPLRVVYLIGAGASQACVTRVKSPHGILMSHLGQALSDGLRKLVKERYAGDDSLSYLVNTVIDETTDFEHVITFLDDSPSRIHRQFAEDMRRVFEKVLEGRLARIFEETGKNPIDLYSVLLDMYNVRGFREVLKGIITTNYDEYIEEAVMQTYSRPVDFGFRVHPPPERAGCLKLLKLHGSFGWQETWPTSKGTGDATLWIPPGIQKTKRAYPFNVIWGLARELLACDILRIIGCRLSANDWDLISLLFTTRHINTRDQPYQVEVIDAPSQAEDFKTLFPYLEIQSVLEIDQIGSDFIAELAGIPGRQFDQLTDDQRRMLVDPAKIGTNWFELWLRLKAESLHADLDSISTQSGSLESFLEGA